MCQNQDGTETLPTPVISFGKTCMRCEDAAVVALKANDLAFCRSCFLSYFTHKFRSTIGKSKLVKKGEKVLLAFSGGHSSSALLHLVKAGLEEEMHKRLRFHPGIVYIDEGAVTNKNKEERLQVSDSVQSIMRRYDFPTHIATLEQVFDLERSSVDENPTTDVGDRVAMAMPSLSADMGDLTLDSVQTKRLKYMLANTKSVTAKEDLVQILRHRLLMDIARRYGYDKIMLGDCSTKLSISILADLAKGRGASIPLDTNFADRRYGDVFFLRPMREFTSKEIGIYNHFHNIDSVVIASLTTKCPVNASINRLTETFVTGLQVDFPSTVNTVFRTGEKLCVTDSSDNSPVQYCILCRSLLDTMAGKSSALKSTELSLSLMKNKSTLLGGCCNDSGSGCCGQGDGSCHSNLKEPGLTQEELCNNLCYACRVTARDLTDTDNLPGFIIEEARRRIRRSQMKKEFEGFLLEED